MFKALIRKWFNNAPRVVAFECNISDIEKDGCKATGCLKCDGTRAKVLRGANGRVSAVCAGCGCTVFRVQVKP